MYKFILIFIISVISVSCTTLNKSDRAIQVNNTVSIVGLWAMQPLQNGIANVAEFTNDGKSNLHIFNCHEKSTDPVESASYTITENGNNIRLITDDGEVQNLKLISMDDKVLTLGQMLGDELLKFSYIKVNRIEPLCMLYKESKDEQLKNTAFKESDFIHAPWIPEAQNILRYVGKWADEKGLVHIEVKLHSDGRYMLFLDKDENWNYLFNQVRWSDSNLLYQQFVYSNKPELYDHSLHKFNYGVVLSPVGDLKIKWSIFISDKRFDYILTRKD